MYPCEGLLGEILLTQIYALNQLIELDTVKKPMFAFKATLYSFYMFVLSAYDIYRGKVNVFFSEKSHA
jgi:hypothetical protein